MSKYGFVNKPIKTTEAEWDRIFNNGITNRTPVRELVELKRRENESGQKRKV